MSLVLCNNLVFRGLYQGPLRTAGQPSATSAVAGGCRRGVRRCFILVRTAQRDDVEEPESRRTTHSDANEAPTTGHAASTTSRGDEMRSSRLAFKSGSRLPNLSCNPLNPSACLNVRAIDDPCLDDSLDLRIFQYMVELVRSGTTAEDAAAVIAQWSNGGGVDKVDVRKLRGHFRMSALWEVARKQLAPAVTPMTLACLSYWSLGLLPATDEAVLPPAVRGALVAANLLLLVYFASGSLRRAGRLLRIGRAALDFSSRAELVLLAMRDLANGHGALVRVVDGAQTSSGTSLGPAAASTTAAAQRHSARQRVLAASGEAMRHVKRQAAAFSTSASSSPSLAAAASCAPASASSSAPLSSLDSYMVMRELAAVSGGFDAAAELGMAAEEVTAATAMYARYGDAARGCKIGDYELRVLLRDADVAPLSEDERRLLLALHAGRRSYLSFKEWAAWWSGTRGEGEAEGEGAAK